MSLEDKIVRSGRIIAGGVVYGGVATEIIAVNTNNLLIPNLANVYLIRINATGNYSLTGIIPADITQAQAIQVFNIGSGNLSFKDNDAGSSANNRFLIGSDRTVQTNEGIGFVYDPISLRWRGSGVII